LDTLPMNIFVDPIEEEMKRCFAPFFKQIGRELRFRRSSSMPWFAYWVISGRNYQIEKGNVKLLLEGEVVAVLDEKYVDFFVMMYCENGPLKAWQLCSDIFADIPLCEKNFVSYLKDHRPDPLEKSGQLKLLCNALDVIDVPEVNLVVIGSGGPSHSRSGASYVHLMPLLKGKAVLYDPYEVSQKVKMEKCVVEFKSAFFHYNEKRDETVTHVIDDSYDIDVVRKEEDKPELKKLVYDFSDGYVGPFVVVEKYDTCFLMSCTSHKDKKDLSPSGGGHTYFLNGEMVIYGSSNTFGPYNSLVIKRLLPEAVVKPPTAFSVKGKMEKLMKIFPKAIISTKFLRNQVKTTQYTEVVDQHFYDGLEQREYYRVKAVKPNTNRHCFVCGVAKLASVRLKIPEEKIINLFALVGGYSCDSKKGVKKKHVRGEVLVLAKTWTVLSEALELLESKYHWKPHVLRQLVRSMAVLGQILIIKSGPYERLALPCHTIDSKVSLNLSTTLDMRMKTLIKKYEITVSMGEYSRRIFKAEKEKILYVGPEYNPGMDVVYVTKPTVQLMAKYEKTHVCEEFETISHFVHKKYYEKAI